MQQIQLPPEIKVPGIIWIILLLGGGYLSATYIQDVELVGFIIGFILIVLRVLVNNDASLEQAVGAGQVFLDWVLRKRATESVTPGMRAAPVEMEPPPTVVVPRTPNKWVSVLLG